MPKIKVALKNIMIMLAMLLLFLCIVVVTQFIPQEWIRENAWEGCVKICEQGYDYQDFRESLGQYDNWTDAFYINIIVSQDATKPVWSAIANKMAIAHEPNDFPYGTQFYAMHLAFSDDCEYEEYSNYWLGVNLLIKLLLIILPFSGGRYICFCITVFLASLIAVYGYKRFGRWQFSAAYLLATISFGMLQNVSYAHVPDYMMMQIMTLFILASYDKEKWTREYQNRVFLILGMNQCFWGFLLAPMMVLTMTILVLVLVDREYKNEKSNYIGSSTLYWILGYAVTGGVKQALAKVVVGNEIASQKLVGWTNGSLSSRIEAMYWQIENRILAERGPFYIWILTVLLLIVLCFIGKLAFTPNKKEIFSNLGLLVLCYIYPSIYCAILVAAKGHCYYVQNYMPWAMCGIYMLFCMFSIKNNKDINNSGG